MAGWFDACPGFAITVDRAASFDFTDPYLTTMATFAVAPGNPANFDPCKGDYSAFKLCEFPPAFMFNYGSNLYRYQSIHCFVTQDGR